MCFLVQGIVNRGDWLESTANIKGTNKDIKIHVGRSATLHNLLFCPHILCMNYVTNTFLLLSFSERSKQLLHFVQGQGQKNRTKTYNKELWRVSLPFPSINYGLTFSKLSLFRNALLQCEIHILAKFHNPRQGLFRCIQRKLLPY